VRGTIGKFGTKLTLSVELYKTENGTLVVTSETVRSGNIEEEYSDYVYGRGHLFSIYRSITYHKPKPKSSATANNFNPYDGLKLAILPTESGDYKVYARYDYSF
jgi:hypothetical protein